MPEDGSADPDAPAPVPASDKNLTGILASILDPMADDLPAYQPTDLTDTVMYESFTFLPYEEGYHAASADALIGAIAHSVVLVEVPDGADADAVAEQLAAKANPRKWICVEAESVQVAVKGQLVLLVMSDTATADAIIAAFNALSL